MRSRVAGEKSTPGNTVQGALLLWDALDCYIFCGTACCSDSNICQGLAGSLTPPVQFPAGEPYDWWAGWRSWRC